ncbi:helix-turn-helix domain-containing protein [Streptomyces sp. NPDC004539]|uniref:ArsR/SmtB family transcription factor n=1 Tax=Streptomyces sp. NPDC004539 TaxID=3154280 RepID=UPI0033AD5166
MLRIHFTREDVARVRVAPGPDPLWEITNSYQALITEGNAPVFGEWRRLVRPRLPAAGRLLGLLLPPQGYSPDFLTPDLRGHDELEGGVDTVLATPRPVLHRDLGRLAASRRGSPSVPSEIRALADGDLTTLHRLRTALLTHHRYALAPFWTHIRAQLDADRALRGRAVMEGGTDGLLAGFRPLLRWRPPVLEADYPVHRELRLDGRGLLLQPSFFCVRRPVMLADPDLPPVLVHPVQHTPGWARRARGLPEHHTPLAALIGRTRAALLTEAATGRTTGELARRLRISDPAASYHTAVLRRAGLVLSIRHGKTVVHTITPAGLALLHGSVGTGPGG